jgi:hypothetical protein
MQNIYLDIQQMIPMINNFINNSELMKGDRLPGYHWYLN